MQYYSYYYKFYSAIIRNLDTNETLTLKYLANEGDYWSVLAKAQYDCAKRVGNWVIVKVEKLF